jgi:hypothetical protein
MSESSGRQVAFVLQNLTVKDGADKDDFEKFMLEKLFPSVDTSGDGEEPDQHFLLGGSSNEYLWMSRLEYSVHQTPFPTWLMDRVRAIQESAQGKLEPFATRTSSETYFDVARWRRFFGR